MRILPFGQRELRSMPYGKGKFKSRWCKYHSKQVVGAERTEVED